MKNTEKKQQELKCYLKQIGLSQRSFAKRWFMEHNDTDADPEIRQFEETFKKQLSRASTDEELIDTYIKFLLDQREAKSLDLIRPVGDLYPKDELSDRFYQLSKSLNQKTTELEDWFQSVV